MHRHVTLPAALVTVAFCVACGSGDGGSDEPIVPVLADAYQGDADVELVDREAALAAAVDYDEAAEGVALDLAAAPGGFYMDASANGADGLQAPRSATYNNILQAVGMVAAADVVTAAVIAPPAASIGIVSQGVVAQVAPNVWVGVNAVSDGTRTVTGTFTVAWVGTGWLCEMRLSSDDGQYQQTKWFDGYVAADGRLGWWDLYDAYGTPVGVVEWIDDGAGNSELGIAALTGDAAGDVLMWGNVADGTGAVGYWDASRAEDAWVTVYPDQSGELRSPDYAGGEVVCWAIDSSDVTCP